MRTRIALACLTVLFATGCSGVIDALSPRYFYGALTESDDREFCLADPRDDEPDRQRCFAYGETSLPEGVEEGDLLRVRYEPEPGDTDEEWVAVELESVPTS